jgi:hypothetical protein
MATLLTFITDLMVSVAILYAIYGLIRFAARCFLWLVGSIMFVEGACNVQGAGAAPAETRQPSFPEFTASARQAREALYAYERRVLCARSEMREVAARTLETIAQTRALIDQADAIAREHVAESRCDLRLDTSRVLKTDARSRLPATERDIGLRINGRADVLSISRGCAKTQPFAIEIDSFPR